MAVALATASVAAGCSSPQPDAPPAPSVSPSVGHGSLAYCLGQHGMPASPGPVSAPPAGVDPAAWEAAMHSCSSLAPGPDAPEQP